MSTLNDEAEHYVVKAEPCPFPWPCGENYNSPTTCYGCLGNGRRAVLGEATAVERSAKCSGDHEAHVTRTNDGVEFVLPDLECCFETEGGVWVPIVEDET